MINIKITQGRRAPSFKMFLFYKSLFLFFKLLMFILLQNLETILRYSVINYVKLIKLNSKISNLHLYLKNIIYII